jgi:hypothetical protein
MPYALCGDGIAATARDSGYHEGDNVKKTGTHLICTLGSVYGVSMF